MKKLFVSLAILAGFGLVTAAMAGAPPKEVRIEKCKAKMAAVQFPHAKHAQMAKNGCKTCHHSKLEACSNCHQGKAEGKKPGCAEMGMDKNPYHITCVQCHKKGGKGPTKCDGCHKK